MARWATAQAAMRHSTIGLTMNTDTDPKLLDVYGALDSLPSLNLDASTSSERQTMRATGTDDQDAMLDARHPVSLVAPVVAPNIGKRGQSVSFAVHASDDADKPLSRTASDESRGKPSEKALSAGLRTRLFEWRQEDAN